MTVLSWGVYGAFLHTGQVGMKDLTNGRYKAFLFVGVAYFLTAVLAPLAMLILRGSDWNFPKQGMAWSLVAGIMGAIGAFCVLLAFGAKGNPTVVMSIVFAGAPVVSAFYGIWKYPPKDGLGSIDLKFFLGILLAAVGGCLVTLYKPDSAPAKPAPASVPAAVTQASPNTAKAE